MSEPALHLYELPPEVDPEADDVDIADPESARWQIDSPDRADWAMAKLQAASAALGDLIARRDAAIKRAERWFEREARPASGRGPAQTVEFMTDRLGRWAQRRRAETGGRKGVATVNLFGGTVSTRRTAAYVTAHDPDVLVAWARTYAPEIVETSYRVPAAKLKEATEIATVWCCGVCDGQVDAETPAGETEAVWVCPVDGPIDNDVYEGERAFLRIVDTVTGTVTRGPEVPGTRVEPEHYSPTVRPDPLVDPRDVP